MVSKQPPSREVRITRVFKVPSLDPGRLGKEDLVVEYTLGGAQTFTVRVLDEAFTAAQIEAAVRKDAVRWADILGKSLTV